MQHVHYLEGLNLAASGKNLYDVFTVRLESESNIMPPVVADVGGIKNISSAVKCSTLMFTS